MRFIVVNIQQAGRTQKGNPYFIVALKNAETHELIENVWIFRNKVSINEQFEGEIQIAKTNKGNELKKLQIKQPNASSRISEVIEKLDKILALLEEMKSTND